MPKQSKSLTNTQQQKSGWDAIRKTDTLFLFKLSQSALVFSTVIAGFFVISFLSDSIQIQPLWVYIFSLAGIAALILGMLSSMIAFSGLQSQISGAAHSISSVTNHSSHAISQINTHAEKLADSAQDQADAVQRTFTATDSLDKSARKVSSVVSECHESSTKARDLAQEGRHSLEAVSKAIEDISSATRAFSEQVEASNTSLKEIGDTIKLIAGKTNVINEIAFQTKLLSFNASVEAARAGEHGRGFAIVAEQIGNLAQTSGSAASEIEEMLDNSRNQVQEIIFSISRQLDTSLNNNIYKIENGMRLTAECNNEYETLSDIIAKLDGFVEEIDKLSRIQSSSTNEINQSMANLASNSDDAASNMLVQTKHIFDLRRYISQYEELAVSIGSEKKEEIKYEESQWDELDEDVVVSKFRA